MTAVPTSMAEYKIRELLEETEKFNRECAELLQPERFFGLPHFEPDDPVTYTADEDVWPT